MGLETGTYIDSLVVTNPVSGVDSASQGDDHLRLLKSTIKNSFPNITGAMTLTQAQLNALSTGPYLPLAGGSLSGALSVNNLTLNSGSITDSSGAISFGNENLTTTGSITATGVYSNNRMYSTLGTVALPAYTYTGDTDTGMYNVSANSLGFATGGVNALTIDSSQNVTFASTVVIPNDNATSELSFTGTDYTNIVSATTGGFQIGNTAAASLILITNNTTALTIDSSQNASFAGRIELDDSKYAYFGTGNDLQIYHNGTTSSITETTSNLLLRNMNPSGTIGIYSDNSAGAEKTGIVVGGATPYVRLYYNGAEVMSTISGGIKISTATEATEIKDAGSTSATEQDWIEVTVGGVTGYIRVFATK